MSDQTHGLPRSIIVLLAAVSALGPVAMQILLPAIPVIRESFQVTTGIAQLTLSLSMFSIALATLAYGPLSDRFGRKPILLVGIFITVVGSMLCVLAPTIEFLIAGRIVQAAGGAVGLVVARAIVRDVYEAGEAASVIATLVMVMVVMPMISPAIGGELMVLSDWRSVFYLVAGASMVLLVLLHMNLTETLQNPIPFTGVVNMVKSFGVLFRSRVFCGYAFNVAFVSVVFFSFISAAPEIMVTVLRRPPTEYGYYFIMIPAAFMTGNFIARRYAANFGIYRLIDYGTRLGVFGVLLALLLQTLGFAHPLALFMPVAIATFANGVTLPNAQAGAINEFPEMAGTASGLTGFLQMGLSAVAAQLVAVLFNGTVFPMLILMLCAAIISLMAFRLYVPRQMQEVS